MKRFLVLAAVVLVLIAGGVVFAQFGFGNPLIVSLIGFQEVPAVSTTGNGSFTIEEEPYGNAVNWQLTYLNTEGTVTQAHIHLGQKDVNGGITVFLCSNLGNGPVGTQPCPPAPATISGRFTAADVTGGAAAQGIAAGQFNELLRAMRAGVTYANVHSTMFPGGEIRGQILRPRQTLEVRKESGEQHEGH